MPEAPKAAANRLSREKSPYLLQHSGNPVDWYPWGDEAFRKARNDGKPILLSIGYSSCHWCHQMRKESFEDRETAAMINRNFVAIKVDREERPDVDAYFMGAVQAMTGSGGWPLTVFLTPDLRPFYGGTYFPPEQRFGMPSFRQVLEFASKVWKERRAEALETGSQVAEAVKDAAGLASGGEPGTGLVEAAYASLAAGFDSTHGGLGGAPKFPLPLTVSFMLRHHYRTGKELSKAFALKTLDAMAAGGIRDHVGGGFHRYSTDRHWLVPHFEKMLYDNALLARAYTEGFLATGDDEYRRVALETLGWMVREMKAPEGGFCSAQDADSADGEGMFYTWTPGEVEAAVGAGVAAKVCPAYGVTREGNFEGGRTILHLERGRLGEGRAPDLLARLLDARGRRPRPETDTKVIASWNGLAISALAYAGASLGERSFIEAAEDAARFVIGTLAAGGTLRRRFAGGEAGLEAQLEDYSFMALGLLDLFEATGDPRWLDEAVSMSSAMRERFEDAEGGGFYSGPPGLPARLKESRDGPAPSGNSAAAMALVRLHALTGDDAWRAAAERTFRCFAKRMEDDPAGHSLMLAALDSAVNGTKEVVVSAKSPEAAAPLVGVVRGEYRPTVSLVAAADSTFPQLVKATPLLEGREPQASPRAYVCERFACKLPTGSPEELESQLAAGQLGFIRGRRGM